MRVSHGASQSAPAGSPGLLGDPEFQRPTLPGLVDGIVAWDPVVLQCRECGGTLTQPHQRRLNVFMITSGWHFHVCEGRAGVRRCRDCLTSVKAACDRVQCQDDASRVRAKS